MPQKINESMYNVVSVQNMIELVQILWYMNQASLTKLQKCP